MNISTFLNIIGGLILLTGMYIISPDNRCKGCNTNTPPERY